MIASPTPHVLLLLHRRDRLLGDMYLTLLNMITARYTTKEVDYTNAKELFRNGRPQVVLALDGHVTQRSSDAITPNLHRKSKMAAL